MNKLQVGFARVNINPPLGAPINGYFKNRYVEGVRDDLEANALALQVEARAMNVGISRSWKDSRFFSRASRRQPTP